MADKGIFERWPEWPRSAKVLAIGMAGIVVVHAVVLLVAPTPPFTVSRVLTAASAVMAGVCGLWRAQRLPARERHTWRWASAGIFLWALGHTVEIFLSGAGSASSLAVDPADFIYFAGAFPVLMALSTTRETESLRAVFLLNCLQIGMALVLSYVLLYRMHMSAEAAATVMGKIYAAVLGLLAIMALLRVFTWATREERQCIRGLCTFLWVFLAVEVVMDYSALRWNLGAGRMYDLAWSVPFLVAGGQAVAFPFMGPEASPRRIEGRGRLIVEALCPMLITAAIFALAASITRQHPLLGLTAIFMLLSIQATQAAAVQLNYRSGQNLLMKRERELRTAVAALEELSLLDPLTAIANRRRFDAALGDAWRRAVRKEQSISVLMIDVDFFKGVNDLHGHATGDDYLVMIAKTLDLHARRPDDLVARIGGEEFALLLPDTELSGATAIACRLHESIKLLGVVNEASPFNERLTVSIGISTAAPKAGMNPAALMDCADQALYMAKGQGRNRTCVRVLA